MFIVAGGLIVFESWRSRRKETTRREDVETRLAELEQSEKAARLALLALEKELLQQKAKHGELPKSSSRILPREVWDVNQEDEVKPAEEPGLLSWITSYLPWGESPEQRAESVIKESKSAAKPSVDAPTSPASKPAEPESKAPEPRKA